MPANNYIEAIARAMQVLEAFQGQRELPLREFVARTKLVKSSVFRILFTLQSLGYVERTPDRCYSLSGRLRQIAGYAGNALDLGELAMPFVAPLALQFKETVNVGVLDDGEVLYVGVVESPHSLRLAAHAGMRSSVHSTSLGKCLLSLLTRAELDGILKSRPLHARTDRTIRTRARLYEELELVRARGYAVDEEEDSRGARCLAAPILNAAGRVVAAVSISGPAARVHPGRDREFAAALMECCRRISAVLGHKPDAAGAVNASRPTARGGAFGTHTGKRLR